DGVVTVLFVRTKIRWRLGPGSGRNTLLGWNTPLDAKTASSGDPYPSGAKTAPAGGPYPSSASRQPEAAAMGETLRLPVVWLGIGLFLVYAGLEISAGQWSFSLFTESRHVSKEIAGLWVGIYWGSFTVGRIFFGAILTWIRPAALLRLCMAGVALGVALLWWKP